MVSTDLRLATMPPPNDLAPNHRNFPTRNRGDAFRIQLMFCHVNVILFYRKERKDRRENKRRNAGWGLFL